MAFNPTAQNENGFLQSNTYIGKNSLNRTNPYANVDGLNAEQLYGVDTFENRIPMSVTYAIASAGDRTTVTPIYGVTSASDYLKFNLIDESGNEAYGRWISSAPSAAFDISTTALNTANDWKAFFATSKAGAKTEFSFKIESAAVLTNTTATITYANL
jgi:hypothetical protein